MSDAPVTSTDAPAGPADARADAARALRRLGHALIAFEADDDLLSRVAAAADRVATDVEAQPRRQRDYAQLKETMFDLEIPEGGRMQHFEECFVSGSRNPLGIGIDVHREGDEVVAGVELGAAFEGAPGRAHGGIVAAIFDDVLGYLITLNRVPAFTGELTVRYLAPTPMGVPLTFRARLLHRDGRKLWTEAEATDSSGMRVAQANGLFIAVDPGRFRA